MPEAMYISRLTEDIPSQLRPGHLHRARVEIAPIKRVGDCWLVEICTPEDGVFWYEQLVIRKDQSEVVWAVPAFTTDCPECGPVQRCDEDGCCLMCGEDLFHDEDGNPRDTAAGRLLTKPP